MARQKIAFSLVLLQVFRMDPSLAFLPTSSIVGVVVPNKVTNQVFEANVAPVRPSRPLAAMDDGMGGTSDLVGTLARLDQVWKIQQRNKKRSRWTKLFLEKEENGDDDDDDDEFISVNMGDAPNPDAQQRPKDPEDFVYLLEPPNLSSPSCVIVFIGGAGLGSFPQVVYQEFLTRLSNKLNAAILTAPYGIDLDHFKLAKTVGEKCRRALLQCEQDPERLYNPKLPVYCVAHSLGCKLASIYAAATGQEYDGIGFISFNNFSFGSTISTAKEFAQAIQQQSGRGAGGFGVGSSNALNDIFGLAQSFLGNIGLEFSPSPADTERLISMRFGKDRIAKTRLFVLDDDTLDDSMSFLRACDKGAPQLSALPGNHLTPVYFKVDLSELPKEAQELARQNLGGVESASFGSNENLQDLVDEVCGFLLGREPSRRPTLPLLSSGAEETSSASS